ncbi:hypothetical protein [Alkalicoccobacillus gibsonii]|uniref:hypothetical protein n=1 Tax=Alkalicoccobacillus gibsonii TaxID=79881 RepID=UPI003517C690
MKMTQKELETLYMESYATLKDGTELKLVEEDEWTQDGKYQQLNLVFTDYDKYYSGNIGRHGDPFQGWEFDSDLFGGQDAEVYEVEKKEVITTKWVTV